MEGLRSRSAEGVRRSVADVGVECGLRTSAEDVRIQVGK